MNGSFDVFISHASEDKRDFVEPLALALKNAGVNVWYDRWLLRPGDSISRKIDEGLATCRYSVLVLSRAFFEKSWPDSEYRSLVALNNGRAANRIIPIWYCVDRNDVASYSPLLMDVLAIEASLGIESTARQIINVVRPDLSAAIPPQSSHPASHQAAPFSNYDFAPYQVGEHGAPYDALPWHRDFAHQQPCLIASFGEPQSRDFNGARRWTLPLGIRNIGVGAALRMKAFLPCLAVVNAALIEQGRPVSCGFLADDKIGFWTWQKPPLQTIFEYEDISGVLYRQYGTMLQLATPGGAIYRFEMRDIGKPYRVKARIIIPETPRYWIVHPSQ